MRAIFVEKYGLPQTVLSFKEIDKPIPAENEVLIKVKTTSINDYDLSFVLGKPYLYRLLFGVFKPKHNIFGMELAGIVEDIGAKVTGIRVGNEVYGDISDYGFGTFAEYICIHENAIVNKPKSLSFEEATAIPHASLLAVQGLKNLGNIKQGQKILINGGGGGVGTIGVQYAKLYNCEVTGVDAEEKLDMMKSMGYDFVIDYKKEDFTKNKKQYDIILDCKTNKSIGSYLKALKHKGRYVTIGGQPGSLISVFLLGKLIKLFTSKKLCILGLKPNKGLKEIENLFEENKIKCKIDGPYHFEKIPELIQYFREGKHKGKVVIKMM